MNDAAIRSFQSNGISHLFAISGMHITLLSSIIEKLLRKYFSSETTFKITTIILLFYLFLVGLSPSILRGVLFYILFKINNIYYFYIKPVNLFLFIISISLLINPSYIFDVGFQYSYLISLSLIVLSNKLKSGNYLISLFKVSIISSIVSIPISLYNFYEINILSIIYNLFFVPLVSLVIFPSSIVAGIITPIRPIYNLLTNILETSSIFISKINIGRLIFKRLPLIIYLMYFLIILIYLLKKNNKILLILLSCLIIHYLIPYFDTEDYLKVIDIGQGDSLLLHTQSKNILIDTGGVLSISKSNNGKLFYQTISPLLKSSGIKKIDYLIISHGDFDHMGEAKILINNFKVKKVIFNKNKYNTLEENLINLLEKKNIPYYKNVKKINLSDTKLYFLDTGLYDNENDNSNVIYTNINGNKLLLMGDAGIKVEENILKKYNISNIDILKVGHHGSDTSTSKNFINMMKPKVSLISVGENNKFGHPKKIVLKKLEKTKIYRTDKDGTITIKFNKNEYKIEKDI